MLDQGLLRNPVTIASGTDNSGVRVAARSAAATLSALIIALAGPAFAFDLQGHRGARGLAPENTLAAFERALSIGVDTLELDIAVTADGVPVVSHDPFLNPAFTRDATGHWLTGSGLLIHSLTRAQLSAYDVGRLDPSSRYAAGFPAQQPRDGERIPALADLFALTQRLGANTVRFNIEFKTDPSRPADTAPLDVFVPAVLAVIGKAGMQGRVTLQSFDWRTLALSQQLAPDLPTSCLTAQRQPDAETPARVKAAGCGTWSPNAAALSQQLVKSAQGMGLKVLPWTVNDPADMRRLIDWGVDGLISDYPDRLRALVPMPVPAR